jgi:hypothetical protein
VTPLFDKVFLDKDRHQPPIMFEVVEQFLGRLLFDKPGSKLRRFQIAVTKRQALKWKEPFMLVLDTDEIFGVFLFVSG